MKIIIATENTNKLKEISEELSQIPCEVHSLKSQFPNFILPEENGNSFKENALIKIKNLPLRANTYYIADDSGIEVAALNNAPGIYSARYGGITLTDTERTERLLKALSNKKNRNAQFTCVIAAITPNGSHHYFKGIVKGSLTTEMKGHQGFGYDPIFIPDGYSQTFAEAGYELKKKCSHRSIALKKFKTFLEKRVFPQ